MHVPVSVIEQVQKDEKENAMLFLNDVYQVSMRDDDSGVTHLSIKRRDQEPIHDWRDLQQIKNELCGFQREGVELYPAQSRVVDTSNQYHLWVMPYGVEIDIGFPAGFVCNDAGDGIGATKPWKQRKK